jgi:hypothetical protein
MYVEAAFLNATLEEDVYMQFPEGFDGDSVNGTKVLKLDKAVYGYRHHLHGIKTCEQNLP